MSVDPFNTIGARLTPTKDGILVSETTIKKQEKMQEMKELEALKAEEKRTTNGLPKEKAARLAELEKKYGDAPTDMFKLHQQGVQTNDPLSRFSSIFGKGFAGFNKGAPLE